MRRLLIAAAVATALASASPAAAAVVTRRDSAGRTLTFDVRAPRVDVDWYANVVRHLLHGDEIGHAVVQISTRAQITRLCGASAASCYLPAREAAILVVPAGRGPDVVHLLAHEYAHHVDSEYGLTEGGRRWWASDDPAASHWWAVRRIATLLNRGRVTYTYRLGWAHSIGEIFAEDYAVLNTRTATRIAWLAPPTRRVLAAVRTDLRDALAAR